MIKGKFNILVDAAWGSSGKGAAAARLADIYRVSDLSSSNFPNAGHTVVIDRAESKQEHRWLPGKVAQVMTFKTLPSGAAVTWRDPSYLPDLWIGPNAGFWWDELKKEVVMVGSQHALRVHPRAVVMHQRHRDAELPGGSESTEHISSTMSGSGAAFVEKAMRKEQVSTFAGFSHQRDTVRDFVGNVQLKLEAGRTFFHEVSQGYALSINHGTHYPHCTFRDCTPQQAMADFLIRPSQVGDVYLNVRSFPIRVGNNFRDGEQTGYSGDFYPDQKELTWQEVGLLAEMPQEEIDSLAEKERTTVTRKVRRVASQSWSLCREAARACGATKVILNFPQYVHWSSHQVRGGREVLPKLHPRVRSYIDKLEDATELPVVMLGTGRYHDDFVWLE